MFKGNPYNTGCNNFVNKTQNIRSNRGSEIPLIGDTN